MNTDNTLKVKVEFDDKTNALLSFINDTQEGKYTESLKFSLLHIRDWKFRNKNLLMKTRFFYLDYRFNRIITN